MRIGILSDSHGNTAMVVQALDLLRDRGIQIILHCGDIDDASTVYLFESFTTHFVYGNCDHDHSGIRRAVIDAGMTLHEPFGNLELDGKKIAFMHGDDVRLFQRVEQSGEFDYLFYGHTHKAAEHWTGKTRVINPGALHRARPKTILILDVAAGETESLVVDS
jgi:putative phosphoesterase